jgi:Uma2 family endonuclease
MGATATRITVDEFYAQTVEGDHKQLVEGEIIVNEPKLIHMRLMGRLYRAVMAWAEAGPDRGEAFLPTDVRLDDHNLYGPDLIWFRGGRVPANLDAYPEEVPDICVEIRSPGTWRYDVGAKKRVYERSGLPELWLVDDSAQTVLVYRRSAPEEPVFDISLELSRDDALSSPLLPGFSLALDKFFAR